MQAFAGTPVRHLYSPAAGSGSFASCASCMRHNPAYGHNASYADIGNTHWAGASHRLNRDLSRYAKDRTERAREELIAELGSCFHCADLGIAPELEPPPDHASCLKPWLSVLPMTSGQSSRRQLMRNAP
ncbi:antirestriction protein ArdC [Rhizobium sp. BK650]|nr:antirestriction protein ArdC [Rhizobium sp. BK650]